MSHFIHHRGGVSEEPAEDKGQMVKDWSISLGSLEDVFLNVVRSYRENNVEKMVF